MYDDEFDCYYVVKVLSSDENRYFFSPRMFVKSVDLAKKFNTMRSAKRSAKLLSETKCVIEKIKRNNF